VDTSAKNMAVLQVAAKKKAAELWIIWLADQ